MKTFFNIIEWFVKVTAGVLAIAVIVAMFYGGFKLGIHIVDFISGAM